MNRRMWTPLLVGLLAATALVMVGVGAFHAGERHSVVVAPAGTGTPVTGVAGETVRVIGDGHWGWGPPFGFLFPLLFLGLIVLLVAGRRRAYWGHPYWGHPYWGHPSGPGPGPGREGMLAEWHREAHAHQQDEPAAGKDG